MARTIAPIASPAARQSAARTEIPQVLWNQRENCCQQTRRTWEVFPSRCERFRVRFAVSQIQCVRASTPAPTHDIRITRRAETNASNSAPAEASSLLLPLKSLRHPRREQIEHVLIV